MLKKIVFILIIVFLSFNGFAQHGKAKIVRDLLNEQVGSDPEDIYEYNDILYFIGVDFRGVKNMYSYNINQDKVEILLSLGSSDLVYYKYTEENILIFSVYNTGTFKTDGTAANTVKIADNFIYEIVKFNNKLIASVGFDAEGTELAVIDDNRTSIQLLKDINPGSTSSNPKDLIVYNGSVYFKATNPSYGYEYWKTDGTSANTKLAFELAAGTANTYYSEQVIYNNKLYVTVRFSTSGSYFLWESDGTELGTTRMRDNLGGYVRADELYATDSLFFFSSSTSTNSWRLGRSDGTQNGTYVIDYGNDRYKNFVTPFKDRLYFVTKKTSTEDNIIHWTDGTIEGTDMLKLGDSMQIIGDVKGTLNIVDTNKIFFPLERVMVSSSSRNMAVTDGDSLVILENTVKVGKSKLFPTSVIYKDQLIYVEDFDEYGVEFSISDGTINGTKLFLDALEVTENNDIEDIVNMADEGVVFSPSIADGRLFQVRQAVKFNHFNNKLDTIYPYIGDDDYYMIYNLASTANGVYFTLHTDKSRVFYHDFGTGKNTELRPENNISVSNQSGYTNGLFFIAGTSKDDNNHNGVYVYDEDTKQFYLTLPINNGNFSALIDHMTVSGKKVYFSAKDGDNGYQVFVSDGTKAGTKQIGYLTPPFQIYSTIPSSISPFGDSKILYENLAKTNERALMISDGTEAGTKHFTIKEFEPDPKIRYIEEADGIAFFSAKSYKHGQELWITDGTEEGTQLLKDIKLGESSSNPRYMHYNKELNKVFFSADDGINGSEIWISDGTPQGTKMLKNIWEGSLGSNPSNYISIGDKVYFTAGHADYGIEIWVTDGTEEGTKLMEDVVPGPYPYSSNPSDLRVSGDYLYFTCDYHPTYGRGELFYMKTTCRAGKIKLPKQVQKKASVNFDAFVDAEGTNLTYYWTFGDGNSSNDKLPSYTYNVAGKYTVKLKVSDNNGCESTFTHVIEVLEKIGVNDLTQSYTINVWPNPSDGTISIAVDYDISDVVITLSDVTGKTVYTRNMGDGNSFSVNVNLQPGIYFVKLTSKQGDYIQKLIIQ